MLKTILVKTKRFNANHTSVKAIVLLITSSTKMWMDVVQPVAADWVCRFWNNYYIKETLKTKIFKKKKGFGVYGCNNNNIRRRCAPGLLCQNATCILNKSSDNCTDYGYYFQTLLVLRAMFIHLPSIPSTKSTYMWTRRIVFCQAMQRRKSLRKVKCFLFWFYYSQWVNTPFFV